jgi:microcystin-dependent protein
VEQFIGEIRLFPYSFTPRGWAPCDGRTLRISQHTALFSLLGTSYGGDGQVNFALPDLRGRVAVSSGQGPGLGPYFVGEAGGFERVSLSEAQMPSHDHEVPVSSEAGDSDTPDNRFLARAPGVPTYSGTTNNRSLNPSAIGRTGGSQPHENRPPHLVLNYCIALEGTFPSPSD